MRRLGEKIALLVLLLCAHPAFGQNTEQNEMRDTLEKATISALQSDTRKHNTTQTGLIRLNPEFLKSSAAVFGAPDLIKSLQMLPGVAAGNELMSGMYVHGGDGTDTAIKQVKEGDLISINAGMTGLNDVYGYTEMPGLPEISDVKVENNVLIDSISYTVLHLKTDRKPDPDDYYAVHIIEERTMTFPDTLIVDTTFIRAMIQSGEDGVPEFASLNDNNGLFPFIKAPVILFPASAFKHNECALSLLSFGFIFPDMTLRSRYKLLVSKVSEEFYLYSMSLYKSSGDILATLGLAPPQFAWSNIEGGLGFCGALATIETDWYE